MSNLYEYMKKMEIDTPLKMIKNVNNISFTKLFKTIFKCYQYSVELEESDSDSQFFDFAANQTLSGAPYPCSYFPHRIQMVEDLINFCYLYSDSISIANPLEFVYYFIKNKEPYSEEALNRFKTQCVEGLLIILKLERAIEDHKICFTKQNFVACKHHLVDINKEQKRISDQLYKSGVLTLKPIIKSKINARFETPNTVVINGLSSLFLEDEIALSFKVVPKDLIKYINKYKKVPISLINDYVGKKMLTDSVDSVMLHYGPISKGKTRTFLTTNPIESMLLNNLNENGPDKTYSHNVVKGLTHSLPFIRKTKLEKIISLRENRMDDFERYRSSLKRVINETQNCKSQAEFEEALADIVNPELNKLDSLFFKEQTGILKNTLIGASTFVVKVGIGLAFNKPEMVASGLIAGMSTSIGGLIKQKIFKKEQSKNNFYFLWQLKQITE